MIPKDSENLLQEQEGALSPKSHWDKVVGGVQLPRIYDRNQFNIRLFDELFKQFLDSRAKTFFEVGCGSSAWLSYFKKYYGLSVSGLDYSEIGCDIARVNLEYFGRTSAEKVYCADVTCISDGQFGVHDVVFTYGLIEHFEAPQTIIAAINKLVTDKGQIITVVPNLEGLNGFLSRVFMPDIYSMHKIINSSSLQRLHELNGFKTEYCGEFGVFYPYVIPWANSELLFMKIDITKKLFLKLVDVISKASLFIVDKFSVRKNTKFFSPYVVYVGRR